jgi:hypothetical protein
LYPSRKISEIELIRDFLCDFPIPTRSIDRAAFLGKVLGDFGRAVFLIVRGDLVLRLGISQQLNMPFSPSILATLLPASPASSSKSAPLGARLSCRRRERRDLPQQVPK